MTPHTPMHRLLALLLLALVAVITLPLAAQDETPTKVTNQNRTGDLPFSTSVGTDVEHVDVVSGNLIVNIPITGVAGRGMNFNFALRYGALFWTPATRKSGGITYQKWNIERRYYVPGVTTGLGWETNRPKTTFTKITTTCAGEPQPVFLWKNYIYQDADGGKHPLMLQNGSDCLGNAAQDWAAPDVTNAGMWASGVTTNVDVRLADGTIDSRWGAGTYDIFDGWQAPYGSFTDPNGNKKQQSSGGLDTLGRIIVTQQDLTNQILYKVYDSGGTLRTYTVNYGNVVLITNFNQSGPYGPIQEVSINRSAITSIVLPNGRSYAFQYEPSSYGGLTRIDLPTGAYVTYTWGTWADNEKTYRYVTGRTLNVDGQSYQWTFSRQAIAPGVYDVTVTDPLGNQSVYRAQEGTVLSAKLYAGVATGTPLRQYAIDYEYFDVPYGEFPSSLPKCITTTLENGLMSRKEFLYESFNWDYMDTSDPISFTPASALLSRGNVTEIREFEWGTASVACGQGGPGPLVRKTTKEYLHTGNSNYLSRNIVSKITRETVYDGAGVQQAKADFEYDSTAITATGGAPQHDYTNFPSTFIYRGNATKVKKWRNTDGATLTTNYIYDDLGNIRSITDPGLHTTTWDYNDNWSGSGCLPPSNSLAYVKQVTNHLGHRIQLSRFPCTGLVQSRKDENDLLASRPGTTFAYDLFGRLLTKTESDGGQTANAYNDVPPVSVTTTTKITSTLNLVSTAIQDGLGRMKQTQLTSDPEGAVKADTTYDALGRKGCETNPYRGASPPPSTSTCYEYDALSRVTKVIPPDGSPTSNNVATAYAGTTVTVTDQAGKVRKSETDALGRLIRVWEPNGAGSLVNKTRYFYDTLDNLTCVVQLATDAEPGPCAASPNPLPNATWRPRRFTYNSLSQLLKAENPESGTIDYTYDSDGNVLTKVAPKPNQIGALTVTTTYTYDVLHRLTQKSYNDGSTPTVQYGYDAVALSGCATAPPTLTILNGKGRRTAMCHGALPNSGAVAWSYDPEGATLTEKRTLQGSSAITKTISYTYNLDGSMATLVNPSGRTITYTPSAAGHTLSAVDVANNINYATNALFAPHGALTSLKNGFVSGGFAGITTTNSYNTRLQPSVLSAAHAGGTVLSFSYGFDSDPAPGVQNNGNVGQIVNNRDTNRTQNFAYDELNRVNYAWSNGNLWGNKFVYDIWANLNKKLACDAGSPCVGKPQGENLDQTANEKNRFEGGGFTNDSAGNMTNAGSGVLTYDAENRLVGFGGVTYTYDADGNRVRKAGSGVVDTAYWIGRGADPLAESDLNGVIKSEYIFFNGKRTARLDVATNTVSYYFSDHLGSASVVTNATGTIVEESDYYPFGGERVITNSDPNQYKFTGKERDTETGLDYFGARHYSSNLGRYLQPDWDAAPTTVPYADFGNPQSLNLYTYVGNNPVLRFDPDGHCWPASECVTAFQNAVDSATEKVINASINTGVPELAGATTFVAGMGRDLVNGTADAFNAGDAVGACIDSCTAVEMGDAVGQDLSRTSGLVSMAAGAVGGAEALAGKTGTSPLKPKPPGENAAAAEGRAAHAEFAKKVEAKPGWQSQPKLKDPKTGSTVKPDAVSPTRRPVELKPNTKSGRAKGRTQLRKQERATGKKGRVVYYDPRKKR